MRDIMFGYSHLVMSFLLLNASDSDGGAENAGVENAGVENTGAKTYGCLLYTSDAADE